MKLQNIIRVHLFPNRHVIQLSPVRTGSTLVYNLLRECLPNKRVTKAHVYCGHFSHLRIVATIRHPFDCVASLIQLRGVTPDETLIHRVVNGYKTNGGNDLIKIKDKPNLLLLRYEEFVHNYEPIFAGVERLFNLTISPERRAELTRQYSIDNAKKIAASYENFSTWDPVTLVHGRHISKFSGQLFYHEEFFTSDQLKLLRDLLGEHLLALGYK